MFLRRSLVVAILALSTAFSLPVHALTIQEIRAHFESLPDWKRNNNDGYEYNSQYASNTVTRVAVGWMPSRAALEEAQTLGCQLFITYSKLFPGGNSYPAYDSTRTFLNTNRLVILRCHDVWEKRPVEGTRDGLKALLGLAGPAINANTTSVAVYSLPAQTLETWAQHVANRFRLIGLSGIELVGSGNKTITKFALGSGIETEARAMWQQGADAGLITEFQRWREVWWAVDNNVPMIIADHGMTEIPGVLNLKTHVENQWPALQVYFIHNGSSYDIVDAEAGYNGWISY